MPLPTTRWERFLYRRDRYRRRGALQARRGRTWSKTDDDRWVVSGRRWEVLRGPRQEVYLYTGEKRVSGPLPQPLPPQFTYTVSPAGAGAPPHVRLFFLGVPFPLVPGANLKHAVIGYHRRPVLTTRVHPERRSKEWRQDWGCRTCAYYRGFWPDWDPWGRRPNQTDVQNGEPSATFEEFPPPAAAAG